MNDNIEDIEIDLVRLFKYLLSKYKIHLILAVIFSLLFFSYKFYKFEFSEVPLEEINKLFTIEKVTNLPNGQKKTEKEKVNYKLYKQNFYAKQSEYETALKNIEFQRQKLESDVAELEKEEQIQKEYMQNSILYNIKDPASYKEHDYLFVIMDKYPQLKNQSTNSIKKETDVKTFESPVLDFTEEILTRNDLSRKIAKELKIPVEHSYKQIQELFTLKKVTDNTFFIETKGNSPEAMNILKEHVKQLYQQLNDIFQSQYQISYSQSYFGAIDFPAVEKIKTEEFNNLITISNDIENKKNEIANLQEPAPFEEKLIDLNTYKYISYIKFALMGIAVGLFISLCIFGCKYLFDGNLKDSDYLQKIFEIKKIACIHDGDFLPKNSNEEKKLSQAVEFLCKDKSKLSIVSTLNFDDIQEAVKIVENVLQGSKTEVVIRQPFEIKDITVCDAVLLLEKLDITDVDTAISEIKFLKDINCNIIGIAYA